MLEVLMQYNIYCDESCHLEKDKSDVMILGAMYCTSESKGQIFTDIRKIKEKHGLSSFFEIKWTKVSESKIDFYKELVEYFWNNQDLSYRVIVASGKSKLKNIRYNQGDYDLWYYKMYFLMLNIIIDPSNLYHIMIDKKDSKGGERVRKLHDVLCNNIYDFKQDVIRPIAQIDSKESEILQLADLFNGAIGYHYRRLDQGDGNKGKKDLIEQIGKYCDIDVPTAKDAQKFNLFVWKPRS